MVDPRFAPNADPRKGQALDLMPDWVPNEEEVASVEMTMETRPELCKLAKQMADELGERHPQAWYYYIGWANALIVETQKKLPRGTTYREILKSVGL